MDSSANPSLPSVKEAPLGPATLPPVRMDSSANPSLPSVKEARGARPDSLVKEARGARPGSPVKGVSTIAQDLDRPLYPEVFEGFSELPVAVSESKDVPDAQVPTAYVPITYTDDDNHLMLYGFDSQENRKTASLFGDEDKIHVGSPKRTRVDVFAESIKTASLFGDEEKIHLGSPKRTRFNNSEELLSDKETRIESLKRNIAVNDDSRLVSPKRAKADLEEGTIWAQSPNEPIRLAATLRSLWRHRNILLKKREALVGKRETLATKRETLVAKREAVADMAENKESSDLTDPAKKELAAKRETLVAKRETLVAKRETLVEKREEIAAMAEEESSDPTDLAKKDSSDPTDSMKKECSAVQVIEDAKERLETADAYATLGEKILNIPRRGKEVMESYQENKQLANKFKSYLGTVTTTAVQVARASLANALFDAIGLGGSNAEAAVGTGTEAGGEPSIGVVDDDAAKGSAALTGAGGDDKDSAAVPGAGGDGKGSAAGGDDKGSAAVPGAGGDGKGSAAGGDDKGSAAVPGAGGAGKGSAAGGAGKGSAAGGDDKGSGAGGDDK